MTIYYTGQAIDITMTVVDRDETATTPSSYTFTVEDPSGNEAEYDNGHAQITVVGTGTIRLELAGSDIDEAGWWRVTFEASTPDVVDSGTFRIVAQEHDK